MYNGRKACCFTKASRQVWHQVEAFWMMKKRRTDVNVTVQWRDCCSFHWSSYRQVTVSYSAADVGTIRVILCSRTMSNCLTATASVHFAHQNGSSTSPSAGWAVALSPSVPMTGGWATGREPRGRTRWSPLWISMFRQRVGAGAVRTPVGAAHRAASVRDSPSVREYQLFPVWSDDYPDYSKRKPVDNWVTTLWIIHKKNNNHGGNIKVLTSFLTLLDSSSSRLRSFRLWLIRARRFFSIKGFRTCSKTIILFPLATPPYECSTTPTDQSFKDSWRVNRVYLSGFADTGHWQFGDSRRR